MENFIVFTYEALLHFLYLNFDRNDDIFEVVYDTEINGHANWIYFGL